MGFYHKHLDSSPIWGFQAESCGHNTYSLGFDFLFHKRRLERARQGDGGEDDLQRLIQLPRMLILDKKLHKPTTRALEHFMDSAL